jgi:very-short-patch-repair endonuclease
MRLCHLDEAVRARWRCLIYFALRLASGDMAGVDLAMSHADRRIRDLAARQDSVVSFAQLLGLGLGRGAIHNRVKRGLLYPMHQGVYGWGVPSDAPWTRARAAALACGTGAMVTHHASLALRDIRPLPSGPIDISVVGRRMRRDGIRTHVLASIDRADWRWVRGVAVSNPARALLEVASELRAAELAEAVERAQVKRLVTKHQLEAAIARAGHHRGVRPLRALAGEPFTRSKAERLVVALVRAARLSEPAFNATAEGFEVDVLWRRERVVLEFDSYEFHATRAAFERDRRRTVALTRAEYVVLRATWTELTRESHALVARIAEALARNRTV